MFEMLTKYVLGDSAPRVDRFLGPRWGYRLRIGMVASDQTNRSDGRIDQQQIDRCCAKVFCDLKVI